MCFKERLSSRCQHKTSSVNSNAASDRHFWYFLHNHLVFAASTCLPCRVRSEKLSESRKELSLAEPAFSVVTLDDTSIFNPRSLML